MRKLIVLILLCILPVFVFAGESYLDFNYTRTFSDVSASLWGISESAKTTTSLCEIAVSNYWGHYGIVYKFRAGRVISIDDVDVDSDIGFNNSFGFSYITDITKSIDFVIEALFQWASDDDSGYTRDGYYYTIKAFVGDIHGAAQFKFHLSPIFVLNAGVDVGFPLFYTVRGGGYFAGERESIDVSGYRFSPFIGFGFKVR